MNIALVLNLLGRLLTLEAGLMLPALLVTLSDGARDIHALFTPFDHPGGCLALLLGSAPRAAEQAGGLCGGPVGADGGFGACLFMFQAPPFYWDAYLRPAPALPPPGPIFSQVE